MCEHWTAIPIDDTKLPDSLTLDDTPLAWRNTRTDTVLTVKPDPREDYEWAVAGPNSIIRGAESLEEAKEKAKEYMRDTQRPSGMV
jgi:hypothetical protein